MFNLKGRFAYVIAAAGIVSAGFLGPARADFSGIIVLGASSQDDGVRSIDLKDPGYIGLPPPHVGERASNGPIPVEYLADILGLDYDSAVQNYAVGGAATSSDLPGAAIIDDKNLFHPTSGDPGGQFGRFLANNPGMLDPGTMVLLAFGGNDIGTQRFQPDYSASIANLRLAVDGLQAKGVKNFVFSNPDPQISILFIGLEEGWPGYSLPEVEAYIADVRRFNAELNDLIADIATEGMANVVLYDHALFVDIVRNDPGKFGFVDLEACFRGWLPPPADLCSNPETTLNFDVFHLSTQANRLEAEYVASVLTAPEAIVPIIGLAGASGLITSRQFSGHLNELHFAAGSHPDIVVASSAELTGMMTPAPRGWRPFLLGEIGFVERSDTQLSAGYEADATNVSFGFEYLSKDRFLGLGGGYGQVDGVVSDLNSTDVHSYHLGAFGGLEVENWFLGGAVQASMFEMTTDRVTGFVDSIARSGTVDGTQYGGFAHFGYRWQVSDSLQVLPKIGARALQTDLDGYNENGALPGLNITVPDQELETQSTEVGATFLRRGKRHSSRLDFDFHVFWVHEFSDDARVTRLGVVGNPSLLTGLTDEPDRDFGRLGVAAKFELNAGGVFSIGYERLVGHNYDEENHVQFRASIPFQS